MNFLLPLRRQEQHCTAFLVGNVPVPPISAIIIRLNCFVRNKYKKTAQVSPKGRLCCYFLWMDRFLMGNLPRKLLRAMVDEADCGGKETKSGWLMGAVAVPPSGREVGEARRERGFDVGCVSLLSEESCVHEPASPWMTVSCGAYRDPLSLSHFVTAPSQREPLVGS